MEDPLEDRAEAYVEDSADDRVDDDRVEDQAEPHMEDPPENRVDDDRVEDPAKAHVEALAEDRVDDDGVLKDRVDDRVEDAADDRVKLEKDFILFLYGISFYHNKEFVGAGNNLFNFFPVLKASLLKRHLSCPYSPNRFFFKLWKPNTLIASTQNLQRRLGVWGLRFSFLDLPFLPSPVWVVLGAELGCCRAAGASFDQLSEALGAVGVRRAGLRSVTGGIGMGSSFSIYL
ncbi:hypothetical protein ACOSQ2_006861 [Xanthoceras sorbifolium]